MSASSINDPTSVAALLEQLRASSAWQQIVNNNGVVGVGETSRPPHDQEPTLPTDEAPASRAPPAVDAQQPTVAELLAQLKAPGAATTTPPTHHGFGTARQGAWDAPSTRPATNECSSTPYASTHRNPASYQASDHDELTPFGPPSARRPPAEPAPFANIRSCTFQEALPLLARLGEDCAFVEAVKRMKQDQDNLERQLWADREAIQKKYADKVKAAKTTASMVGANGLSKHEATMLQDSYQKEMRKFDKERVLPTWDGVIARQQEQLESLGVPNMFVTSDAKDTQKQIINVLLGLIGNA